MAIVSCIPCNVEAPTSLSELRSLRGQLWCSKCRRIMNGVAVPEAHKWIVQQAKQKAEQLSVGQQAKHHNPEQLNQQALGAELATCLVLCPGSQAEWVTSVKTGGNNRGCDLLRTWTELDKPVEVKSISRAENPLRIHPPGAELHMHEGCVEDSYYVLVEKKEDQFSLRGWVNRDEFLERKMTVRSGGEKESWGVLPSKLNPMASFPRSERVYFVSSEPTDFQVGYHLNRTADLWWGYSTQHGWVFLNWNDPRNKPGCSPRYLFLTKCSTGSEIQVRFMDWAAPDYRSAENYIESQQETAERERTKMDLMVQQQRILTDHEMMKGSQF